MSASWCSIRVGAHDCFNVVSDLRPRMVSWLVRQLEKHHLPAAHDTINGDGRWEGGWAAEAVDPDFADALRGDAPAREWIANGNGGMPVQWEWPWLKNAASRVEVVLRTGSRSST